jgi:ABC-type multidrug transport system fused ATPase/permease subunit
MLPNVINMIVEASVSMRRIQDFLSAPDYKPPASLPLSTSASNSSKPGVVIQMRDTTVTYEDVLLKTKFSESSSSTLSIQEQIENTESQLLLVNAKLADAEERLAELNGGGAARKKNYGGTKTGSSSFSESDTFFDKSEKLFSLRHIDFECCEGEFVAVVGIVGSGKSTLLKTILGESQIVSGHVSAVDKVAYFDQKPFIMNDTVKNNVLFGKDVDGHEDTELYRLSIKSACLEHDLKILAQGDQTEIGERGITLRYVSALCLFVLGIVFHP